MLRVLIAGATGWAGAPLARAVDAAPDLELAGGIARRGADYASVADALSGVEADVLVDYTSAAAVRANVDAALAAGLHVVVGSSGLSEADYTEIDAAARAAGRGVIAAGNFSVLAATLLHAATIAAAHIEHWEVIDYGSAAKPDAPSGTSRELAERLAEVHEPAPADHDGDLTQAIPKPAARPSPAPACIRYACPVTRCPPTSSSPRRTNVSSSGTRRARPPRPTSPERCSQSGAFPSSPA
jgi:4-hydroxy-tetrahydrodipicolinate reductase